MKRKYILPVIMLLALQLSYAQREVRFYIGMNQTSITNVFKKELELIDSMTFRYPSIRLPHLGMDYEMPLSSKLSVVTGIGFSAMGTAKYQTLGADTIVYDPDGHLATYYRENADLRLNYLRIPLYLRYRLGYGFSVFSGYTLNYTIRKNHSIFDLEPDTCRDSPRVGYPYNIFHHAAIFGLRKDWKNFNISANGHVGLNRIKDTRDFYYYENTRVYWNMIGFQVSVGYSIKEE